jgi:hypothetical protein
MPTFKQNGLFAPDDRKLTDVDPVKNAVSPLLQSILRSCHTIQISR